MWGCVGGYVFGNLTKNLGPRVGTFAFYAEERVKHKECLRNHPSQRLMITRFREMGPCQSGLH